MKVIVDVFKREVRLTDERFKHIVETHLEMQRELEKIIETLQNPDEIRRSNVDEQVELWYKQLWYKHYKETVVGEKFMCISVKNLKVDFFIITSYFTDKIKRGELLWKKK